MSLARQPWWRERGEVASDELRRMVVEDVREWQRSGPVYAYEIAQRRFGSMAYTAKVAALLREAAKRGEVERSPGPGTGDWIVLRAPATR